jgi:hypothetical protein
MGADILAAAGPDGSIGYGGLFLVLLLIPSSAVLLGIPLLIRGLRKRSAYDRFHHPTAFAPPQVPPADDGTVLIIVGAVFTAVGAVPLFFALTLLATL